MRRYLLGWLPFVLIMGGLLLGGLAFARVLAWIILLVLIAVGVFLGLTVPVAVLQEWRFRRRIERMLAADDQAEQEGAERVNEK